MEGKFVLNGAPHTTACMNYVAVYADVSGEVVKSHD
jgi:hypothetical protein